MANTARFYTLETIDRPSPLRTVRSRARLVPDARAVAPMTAFSPIEEDFFARAADLYPPADSVDEWDQLFAAVKVGL